MKRCDTDDVHLTVPDNDAPYNYMVIDVGDIDEMLIAVHEGDFKAEIVIGPSHVPMIISALKGWYENTREQD